MDVGMELDVTFTEARSGGVTAESNGSRFFLDRHIPQATDVNPGEHWRVRVISFIRDNLWRVKPLRLLEDPPENSNGHVATSERYVGQDSPEHLAVCLRSLPEEFGVVFRYQDTKGVFGLYGGIAIRPCDKSPVTVDTRYRVTPVCSGTRGIYVQVVAVVEPGQEDYVPDEFEMSFDRSDGRGIYAMYRGYIVRPDGKWLPRPEMGWSGRVAPITVLRDGVRIVFVRPLGRSRR